MSDAKGSLVCLASVKHQLYNPSLPTLRRMEMDTVLQKLSTEHCRHTSSCSKEDFMNTRSTLLPKASTIPCQRLLDGTIKAAVQKTTLKHTEGWLKLIGTVQSNDNGGLQFTGLVVRNQYPHITSVWQRPLSSSQLLPAAMYSRYRTSRRPSTTIAWKH